MISVTGATGKYILQPSLVDMHQESLELISAAELWKNEIDFFQKLLDQFAQKFQDLEDKKLIDHFQSLIIYYGGGLIPELQKKIRDHEKDLARMLGEMNESDTEYFNDHKGVVVELYTFLRTINQFRNELYNFIQKAMN